MLAQLVFEVTEPPETSDIRMFAALRRDNVVQCVLAPEVESIMAAGFTIPEKFSDCEVYVYVWDKNMKPLMDVQKIDLKKEP